MFAMLLLLLSELLIGKSELYLLLPLFVVDTTSAELEAGSQRERECVGVRFYMGFFAGAHVRFSFLFFGGGWLILIFDTS